LHGEGGKLQMRKEAERELRIDARPSRDDGKVKNKKHKQKGGRKNVT
jgi:hypothetical protein